MKRFLITYTFALPASEEAAWHARVREFVGQLRSDPELGSRIRYRVTRSKESGAYYHLAEPSDEDATRILGTREWFKRYTEETKRVSGGAVTVIPLETIADTAG